MSTSSTNMGFKIPSLNDVIGDTIAELGANFRTIDDFYPIGTIYQSTRDTNPGDLFGGTWRELNGMYLMGHDSAHAPGAMFGEAEHVITVGEMPAHSHTVELPGNVAGPEWVGAAGVSTMREGGRTANTGGNQPMNLLPPSISIYIWERIA